MCGFKRRIKFEFPAVNADDILVSAESVRELRNPCLRAIFCVQLLALHFGSLHSQVNRWALKWSLYEYRAVERHFQQCASTCTFSFERERYT